MRSLVACFGVFLACCLIPQTACMTNREFVDLMMDSAEAVEEYYPGDDSYYVEDDGTIQLPGGPDDELDLEYLMVQSGLPDRMMTQLASLSRSTPERSALGWWRRRRRTPPRPTGCSCRNKSCHCCASHTFRLNLLIKKVSFTLHACSYVTYLTGEGIELRFTLNNRNMFHKQMSIRYPPTMCYGVPGLKYFAKACLRLYNVNLVRKSFCLKVEGQLNLLFKKYRVNLKLGCYRVVAPNEEELGSLLNDSEALMTYLTSGDPSIDKTGSIKLTETRSLQELMQHAEITEIDQEDETMETS